MIFRSLHGASSILVIIIIKKKLNKTISINIKKIKTKYKKSWTKLEKV